MFISNSHTRVYVYANEGVGLDTHNHDRRSVSASWSKSSHERDLFFLLNQIKDDLLIDEFISFLPTFKFWFSIIFLIKKLIQKLIFKSI